VAVIPPVAGGAVWRQKHSVGGYGA